MFIKNNSFAVFIFTLLKVVVYSEGARWVMSFLQVGRPPFDWLCVHAQSINVWYNKDYSFDIMLIVTTYAFPLDINLKWLFLTPSLMKWLKFKKFISINENSYMKW